MDPVTKRLKAEFEKDLTEYRAIPFWSWNNALDERELCRQIDDMKAAGLGGFIMHARLGLSDEYLGEKWFSCIRACLDHAKKLGMNAWVYDENGWPSGFVGGKLLERVDFRAQFLTLEVRTAYDPSALCVFKKEGEKFVRLHADEGGVSEYYTVLLNISPSNTDILNPECVAEFIRQTHEEYYRRFAPRFGRELAGFFTDEPQCYRYETPYSPVLRSAYIERYGEDPLDAAAYLFVSEEAGRTFKYRYYTLMNELYVQNFYRPLYEWCEAHGCRLTGHSIEENGLSAQMMGGAGVMATYEYEHVPAIDKLGRDPSFELPAKQIGSVASQLGIRHVLTETFACSGNDVTPGELKSIAEAQFFNGVNMMCHHLYPYSMAGQGKHDHPPVFSRHSGWFGQFREFNEYFTRLGYIGSNTADHVDLLVLHPLRSMYMDFAKNRPEFTEKIDAEFSALLADLRRRGICYQLADETLLAKYGSVEGETLKIGKMRYTRVLVPKGMCSLSSDTYRLLRAYRGELVLAEHPTYIDGETADVDLTETLSYADMLEKGKYKFTSECDHIGLSARYGDLGEFVFIKNYSRIESASAHTEGIAESFCALDLLSLTLSPVSSEITLGPSESVILVRAEGAKDVTFRTEEECITDAFRVSKVGENALVLDYGQIGYDGVHFGERLPLPRIFEDLLRADYRGKLFLRYTFRVKEKMPLSLMIERQKYTSLTLNAAPLTFADTAFDVNFVRADVTDLVREGENEFVISMDYFQHDGVHFALFDPMATESLRNCLYYDCGIENAYVLGDFVLDSDLTVCPRTALPPMSADMRSIGYPFFKEDLVLEGSYDYDGVSPCALSLDGRFLIAEADVNGSRVDFVTETVKDVTPLLKKGENEIRIRVQASLRNFFGPHHCATDPEPLFVSPTKFTMRRSWKGGMAPDYSHSYFTMPFGVGQIRMLHTTAEEKKH